MLLFARVGYCDDGPLASLLRNSIIAPCSEGTKH